MTATATAILVLLDGAALSTVVSSFTFEIIRVTGCAKGRVLGPGIRNRTAYGATVAYSTAQVPSVVARIVPLRVVTETGRRPAVGGMANVALYGCR